MNHSHFTYKSYAFKTQDLGIAVIIVLDIEINLFLRALRVMKGEILLRAICGEDLFESFLEKLLYHK